MSAWWWLAILPAMYVSVGWLLAWAWASHRVKGRTGCRYCGAHPHHATKCGCQTCRTYACDDHATESSGLLVAIWPMWVAVEGGRLVGTAAGHFTPGAVVERQAERRQMHVLVAGEKEEDA